MRDGSALFPKSLKGADWRKVALVALVGLVLCALLLRASDGWRAEPPSILDVRAQRWLGAWEEGQDVFRNRLCSWGKLHKAHSTAGI